MSKACKITSFFYDHYSSHAPQIIRKLLPFLKKHQYKQIAYEHHKDNNVNKYIKITQENYDLIQELNATSKLYQIIPSKQIKTSMVHYYHSFYLKDAITQGVKVSFVDVSLKEMQKVKSSYGKLHRELYESIQEKFSVLFQEKSKYNNPTYSSDEIKEKIWNQVEIMPPIIKLMEHNFIKDRNAHFAKNIDNICKKNGQGIIGSFGVNHANVTQGLKSMGYTDIKSFYLKEEVSADGAVYDLISLSMENNQQVKHYMSSFFTKMFDKLTEDNFSSTINQIKNSISGEVYSYTESVDGF